MPRKSSNPSASRKRKLDESKKQEENQPSTSQPDRKRKRIALTQERIDELRKAEVKTSQDKEQRKVKRKAKGKAPVETVERHWEDWKEIYLVGTEWSAYDDAYKVDWDFDHVEDTLMEDEQYKGKNIYIFGSSEPQLVELSDTSSTVLPVPVLIATVGDIAPPATLGIKSVQMIEETILPMKNMKMSWVPFIPRRSTKVLDRERPNIYVLKCSTRRERLKRMKEEEIRRYEYCIPYIFRPKDLQASLGDYSSEVQVIYEHKGRGHFIDFDWKMDTISDVVEDFAKEHELSERQKQEVEKLIQESVKNAKAKIREERDEKKKKLESIPEYERVAMDNLKFIKFYPQNEKPSVEKSPFINRYYGKADEMIPAPNY